MTFLKNAARTGSYRNTIVACKLLFSKRMIGLLDNKDISDKLHNMILTIGEIITI